MKILLLKEKASCSHQRMSDPDVEEYTEIPMLRMQVVNLNTTATDGIPTVKPDGAKQRLRHVKSLFWKKKKKLNKYPLDCP